tara:strand:+ start:1114 stop:1830 length:717 start_codon:yes stop_codon:yes gene_type:complete
MDVTKNTKIDIHTLMPFGPIILHAAIPMYVVDNYNKYCDKIMANKKQLKKQDHSQNLAGNVRSEFFIDDKFIKEEKNLLNIVNLMAQRMLIADNRGREDEVSVGFLKNAPATTMKILPGAITGCDLVSLWCVSQWAGDFNPLHIHSGDLSGVLYLKMPEGLKEEYEKEDHHAAVGDIQFIAGTPQAFSRNNLKVKPTVGDFYVFPAWLHHTVYPFRTKNEERRSLAFNIVYAVDENKL